MWPFTKKPRDTRPPIDDVNTYLINTLYDRAKLQATLIESLSGRLAKLEERKMTEEEEREWWESLWMYQKDPIASLIAHKEAEKNRPNQGVYASVFIQLMNDDKLPSAYEERIK